MKQVYLDNAAAAPMHKAVYKVMKPYLKMLFANPSGLYSQSLLAREGVEKARKQATGFLGAQEGTIIFTSGGTESVNLAVLGTARANKNKGKHIITTTVEHHAVLGAMRQLEKEGFEVTYLPVDEKGVVRVADVMKVVRPETILISIMYANNEVGTVYPVAEIGRKLLQWRKKEKTAFPMFHTDACQASAYLPMRVEQLHVDLLSLNGSKVYGPKGVGLLYKRRGIVIESIMHGGGQEFGYRSGTENVPGIIGLGKALEMVKDTDVKRVQMLRDDLWAAVKGAIPDVVLNGPEIGEERLPNNLHVSFSGADAEALILYLDGKGIACSAGSACTTNSDEVSHVLLACGLGEERAKSSIRMTLGEYTNKKDIVYTVKVLARAVATVRKMSI